MEITTFEEFKQSEAGNEFLAIVNKYSNDEEYVDDFCLPIDDWEDLKDFLEVLITNSEYFPELKIIEIDSYYTEYKDESGGKWLIYSTSENILRYIVEPNINKTIEIISKSELMQAKLANYKQEQAKLKEELKAFVQDKSIDLEERWEALIECPELGERSYVTDFGLKRFLNIVPTDYRKEIFDVEWIYSTLIDGFENNKPLTPEEEITFKEHCCDNFITSMIFDW